MAAIITDIWEFRATAGDANAGGGFDTASGGTDYSDQDSAQLQLTDLATSGIGVTTLTSVTGGFTAAMVGNYIQIRSGTNVTAGFYRVTARADTNTVTLDREPDDGVGGISGGSGDLGGALDILTDAFLDDADVVIAGNTIHIKNDGSMGTAAISLTKDGTGTSPINIEGYNTSRGDAPSGTNRPLIACGGNSFDLDDEWIVKHLRFTTTASQGVMADVGSIFFNCASNNSSGSNNRSAFELGNSNGRLIACDGQSVNGDAMTTGSFTCRIVSCYLHDSDVGARLVNSSHVLVSNVIDTCGTGVIVGAAGNSLINNTIYNCTTGISGGTNVACVFINNILDANTTGASWSSERKSNFWDFNVWDNGTDVSNVTKGPNQITGDPGLTNPAAGDFTLGGGSNAIDAGLDANDLTGATV